MATEGGGVKIRIGASYDSSIETVFAAMEKRGELAARRIRRSLQGALNPRSGSATGVGQPKAGGAGKDPALKTAEDRARGEARIRDRALRDEQRAKEKAARDEIRAAEKLNRDKERAARKAHAAALRALEKQQEKEHYYRRMTAVRTARRASQMLSPTRSVTSLASRAGADILRGMGVETRLSSIVSNAVEADSIARALSNQGYIEGKSKRVPVQDLKDQATSISKQYGFSRGEVLSGMKLFVDQLGDLPGAIAMASGVAKYARSQNTDYGTMFKMASKIDSALVRQKEYADDPEKRHKKVFEVLRINMMQGKVSSIPIEAAARQMPKITGLVGGFAGNAADNIALLASIAQMSESGPAPTPRTAFTYALRVANDIQSKEKQLAEFGVPLYKETPYGKRINDIRGIVTGIIVGSARKEDETGTPAMTLIKKTLPNLRSSLGVQQAFNVFSGGGGLKHGGLEALDKYWDELMTSMPELQIDDDLGVAMESPAVKMAQFNAAIENTADRMVQELVPALEKLAPAVQDVADWLAGIVTFAADNVGIAITVAIAASIAHAGLESVMRTSLERAMLGPGIVGAGGGKAGAVGAGAVGAGAAGAGVALMGAALTGLTVGTLIATALYAKATHDWDRDTKAADNIINNLRESDPLDRDAIFRAKQELSDLKAERGLIGDAEDLLGIGAAPEIRTAELYIKQREAERRRFKGNDSAMGEYEEQRVDSFNDAKLAGALTDTITGVVKGLSALGWALEAVDMGPLSDFGSAYRKLSSMQEGRNEK